MTGFEKRIQSLNSRRHRRMMLWDALRETDRDEAWRHMRSSVRLARKVHAARDKARLRGEDLW